MDSDFKLYMPFLIGIEAFCSSARISFITFYNWHAKATVTKALGWVRRLRTNTLSHIIKCYYGHFNVQFPLELIRYISLKKYMFCISFSVCILRLLINCDLGIVFVSISMYQCHTSERHKKTPVVHSLEVNCLTFHLKQSRKFALIILYLM